MPTTVVIPPPVNIDVDEEDAVSPFASITPAPFDPPDWLDDGKLSVHFPTVDLTDAQVNAIINLAQVNPPAEASLPPDVAPSTSPTPIVSALGIGAIRIGWTPVVNASPVMYDVYLSASTPVVVDPANLLTSTAASMTSTKFLPDGVTALVAGTTYYSVIQARSGVEMGPVSSEGSGTPVQVTGPDIAANAVNAEHVSAQSIDGSKFTADLLLSSDMRTAESGARDGISVDEGHYSYNSADQRTFQAKDGNVTLTGEVTASQLDVTDGGSMAGAMQGQPGGSWTLGDKLSAPGTAPTVENIYDEVALDTGIGVGDDESKRRGLVWAASGWWVATKEGGTLAVVKFDAAGSVIATYDSGVVTADPNSMALVGSTLYVHCEASSLLYRFDTADGSYDGTITLAGTNTAMRDGVVGPNGSTLLLAWQGTGGMLNWQGYTTAGALSGSAVAPGVGSLFQPASVVGGSFDLGASRVVVYHHPVLGGSTAARPYSTSGIAQASEWFNAGDLGLCWTGTAFASLSSSTSIQQHTDNLKTDPDTGFYPGTTWYDSNLTGGPHETTVSKTSITGFARRAKYRITAAAPVPVGGGADDPDGARFFIGRTSTRTKLELNGTASGLLPGAIAQVELTSLTIPVGSADAVTPPPATSNFPQATPYQIKNGAGEVLISGAGAGPAVIPVGVIWMFYGATAPAGWLICNGGTFSGTTYPALQTFLGGTTLPDLRSRFPVGAGTYTALKESEGNSEGVRSPRHDHAAGGLVTGPPIGVVQRQSAASPDAAGGNHTHNVTGRTGFNLGAAADGESQFPRLGVNFIIRAT